MEYALGLSLITVPLCLRLLTVNRMRIQNQKMRQVDNQLRKITGELDAIVIAALVFGIILYLWHNSCKEVENGSLS